MGPRNRRVEDKDISRNRKLQQSISAAKDGIKSLSNTNKVVEQHKFPSFKVLLICAMCCGFMNGYHVSTLFENDRHFSHLSDLEREMTFRTEMGFYYSYYKTLIEADSLVAGLNSLMYDNRTEYPDTINALQRFNLFPEVVLGGSYRVFESILNFLDLPLPQMCWQVSRGGEFAPVISCEGIGTPVYWYLNGVWVSAGFTAALLFISGAQLSKSLVGGFVTVVCFFFNHGEATRVQWTPPLRESFAYPFSLALNLIVTYTLRKPKVSWLQPLLFGHIALNYLLCWQFSQFTLVANVGILYALYTIGLSPPLPMLLTLLGAMYALVNALIIQFGNPMLLASPLAGVLVGILLLYVFIEPLIQYLPSPTNVGTQLGFLFISSLASKIELSRLLSVEDDRHITNLFRSKFTNYSDFHTKLYTCSKEFDFLPSETINKLSSTLLLPSVAVMVGMVALNILTQLKSNLLKRMEESNSERASKTPIWEGVDAGLVYNLALLVFYALMAGLVMRLKLFLTPHLCVMCSLLASRSLWRHVFKKKEVHYAVLTCLMSGMCFRGLRNIAEQRGISGEYSDPHLEEMLLWIQSEVGKEAPFAGPMPTMANVLLSTGRPIINHPHYESAHLRHRTKRVYSVFSRRKPQEVFETMVSLKASYLILEESWCLRRSRPGCGMVDLWDQEEPHNTHLPSLCPKLFHHNPSPFYKVFSNEGYVILQVPSRYVELPAPRVRSS